ncbi:MULTISPECIES: hypothetical protein [unclassified Corynebacterium]|uniref:hypothetical protein n=1 Tax=unclassified Corynebacterium TaxID=2624378 RepID=UPI0029CA341A|nr:MULTISPECIES: hypothetical protein [unclassified Corynebacterium]WPF65564.1 hypothetical protein OLX12_08265 [Corynebacterium sp. 22KM0430]WPF68059.1 hypothetical protein OLW90_08255 [Corynebacterium sp. 21KM1197]
MFLSTLLLSAVPLDAPVYQQPILPEPIVAQQEAATPEAEGEAHRFSGSGTAVESFQKWFAGEEFVAPDGETKDYQFLELPNGQVARGGDVIVKDANGEFSIR